MTLDAHIFDPGESRRILEEEILPPYIAGCRWFAGKARGLRKVAIFDLWHVPGVAADARLALVRIEYGDGASDLYQLPLQLLCDDAAAQLAEEHPPAIVAREGAVVLCDALYAPSFRDALTTMIATDGSAQSPAGQFSGLAGKALPHLLGGRTPPLPSRVLKVEQSNSAIIYGDGLFLKIFRRLAEGVNPDAEILRFLTERCHFAHAPSFGGELIFQASGREPQLLALGTGVVPNDGDAWAYMLRELAAFYRRASTSSFSESAVYAAIGPDFCARAAQLGQRTGEMHVALASNADDPDFAPEPLTVADQEELSSAINASISHVFATLRSTMIAPTVRDEVDRLLAAEQDLRRRAAALTAHRISAMKTRHHGDYHLGQVLNTSTDFMIIDFEGEPSRSLAERRRKRSPLRDVAGMLRSFHYAAYSGLFAQSASSMTLRAWAESWTRQVTVLFLDAWHQATNGASFRPRDPFEAEELLSGFLLEKALYEIDYELNNRPDWLAIPVRGLLDRIA